MDFATTVRLADGDHAVSFYDGDDDLTAVVGGYLAAAVRDGDTVVVIATPGHCASFAAALRAADVDIDDALSGGRLQLLDAADTLALFMRGATPDARAFRASVGRCVRDAAAAGRPVRAYGEMVALLWAQGNRAGATALERLWNDLAEEQPFTLLCSYPRSATHTVGDADDLASVCHLHSHVVASPTTTSSIAVSQHFSGGPGDPRAARRFVAEALVDWGLDDLIEDCVLVASELTSNAVRHASSAFTVTLLRVGDGVLVGVSDASTIHASVQQPDASQPGGRGLRLVDALSAEWGQTPLATGKRVWAVLGAAR